MKNLQREILGTLLTFPEEIGTVTETLTADEFDGDYRTAFEVMVKNNGADIVTISSTTSLSSTTLLNWMEGNGSRFQLKNYCKALQEKNTVKRIVDIGSTLLSMAQGSTGAQMIDFAEQSLLKVAPADGNAPKQIGNVINDLFKTLEERYHNDGSVVGISTGINELDQALTGLRDSKLYVLAARPSMGKTALATNIAINAALAGNPTLMFSIEMGILELAERIMAEAANVNYGRITSGNVQASDWEKLHSGAVKIKDLPFYIDDSNNVSLQQIKTKARQMYAKKGLRLLVVDYLTLMDIPSTEQRTVAIGAVTRGLKALAKELKIPVVVLAQLSRRVDERTDKKPIMSDLRDSGEIEQDADVIMFPFREAAYCQKCRDQIDDATHDLKKHQRRAEIIIAKNRGGKQNVTIPLEFLGEYQRFIGAGELPRYI